jgi:GxxExxY protein
MSKLLYEDLSYKIIGASKEVYKELGKGFLESVYEDAFCYELNKLNIAYEKQKELDVYYKDVVFERKFRADIIIENKILIENKVIKKISNLEEAQLINYLKISKLRLGLIFNYGASNFEFIRRII